MAEDSTVGGDNLSLIRGWLRERRVKADARKYADPRYRQNPDGSFTGPFKGVAHGRGKPPTLPPSPMSRESVNMLCQGGVESPVWALIATDTQRHAEQEWPGQGLNAVSRAVFIARGGHAPGESCAIDNGLRYDDPGDWDEEMYMNEYREMLAAHYALPWWRRLFHRV